jgi:hypothetical protein
MGSSGSGDNSNMEVFKGTFTQLVNKLPILGAEVENMINVLFSMLYLTKEEIEEIQALRRTPKRPSGGKKGRGLLGSFWGRKS